MLTNQPVANADQALIAAQRLMDKGCKQHVLITLGENGALLFSRNGNDGFLEPIVVKAPEVKAIDTTVRYSAFIVLSMKLIVVCLNYYLGCWRLLSRSSCLFFGLLS